MSRICKNLTYLWRQVEEMFCPCSLSIYIYKKKTILSKPHAYIYADWLHIYPTEMQFKLLVTDHHVKLTTFPSCCHCLRWSKWVMLATRRPTSKRSLTRGAAGTLVFIRGHYPTYLWGTSWCATQATDPNICMESPFRDLFILERMGDQKKSDMHMSLLKLEPGGGLLGKWVGRTKCLQISLCVCHKACLSLANRVKEAQPSGSPFHCDTQLRPNCFEVPNRHAAGQHPRLLGAATRKNIPLICATTKKFRSVPSLSKCGTLTVTLGFLQFIWLLGKAGTEAKVAGLSADMASYESRHDSALRKRVITSQTRGNVFRTRCIRFISVYQSANA